MDNQPETTPAPPPEHPSAACCEPPVQATCCEPAEKAECCDDDRAPASCGCD